MQFFRSGLAALVLVAAGWLPADALKLGAVAPSTAEVAKLHTKLEHVAAALDGMLSAEKKGSLANAPVAPTMRLFLKGLRDTLSETATPQNTTLALQKLNAAQAGMADLTKALTKQQETLMHEGDAEEASLLLGVLMTKRAEPFEKQLLVLQDPEFSHLPVSKELLTKKDQATPLFQQVAVYMDKHGGQTVAVEETKAAKLAKTIDYFSSRVETLEGAQARMKTAHDLSATKFAELIKKSTSKTSAHKLEMYKKRTDREYKKSYAVQQQNLKMMKDVVGALKHGDVNALKKAQDALKAHMASMQRQTGNFLHLLQLGHRLQQRDCPYCAAQCIDKCHTAGNPYTQCLTDCADAGK